MKIASEVAQLLANIDGNEDTSNLVHSKASEYVSILKVFVACQKPEVDFGRKSKQLYASKPRSFLSTFRLTKPFTALR